LWKNIAVIPLIDLSEKPRPALKAHQPCAVSVVLQCSGRMDYRTTAAMRFTATILQINTSLLYCVYQAPGLEPIQSSSNQRS
jgi:hypothetical protein